MYILHDANDNVFMSIELRVFVDSLDRGVISMAKDPPTRGK